MFTLYTSFVFCYKCKKTFAYCLKALFYYDQFTLYITFFTLKQRPFSSRKALENKENPFGCKMNAKGNLARLPKRLFFAIHNLCHAIFRGETILCQGQAQLRTKRSRFSADWKEHYMRSRTIGEKKSFKRKGNPFECTLQFQLLPFYFRLQVSVFFSLNNGRVFIFSVIQCMVYCPFLWQCARHCSPYSTLDPFCSYYNLQKSGSFL